MAAYLLKTRRLGFRHYSHDDLDLLQDVFADEYARTFYPNHDRLEVLKSWIDWSLRGYRDLGFGLWALETLQDGRFIGDAGPTLQQVEGSRLLEVGYHIHPALRGQGLATEAAAACIEWAFRNTSHEAVGSIVDPRNIASIGVASKLYSRTRQFQGRTGRMLLFYTERGTNRAA